MRKNLAQQYDKRKTINCNDYKEENNIEYNSNWSRIPDHSYTILITPGFRTGKQRDYLI